MWCRHTFGLQLSQIVCMQTSAACSRYCQPCDACSLHLGATIHWLGCPFLQDESGVLVSACFPHVLAVTRWAQTVPLKLHLGLPSPSHITALHAAARCVWDVTVCKMTNPASIQIHLASGRTVLGNCAGIIVAAASMHPFSAVCLGSFMCREGTSDSTVICIGLINSQRADHLGHASLPASPAGMSCCAEFAQALTVHLAQAVPHRG